MKKNYWFCLLLVFSAWVCLGQENNDFYDNTPEKILAGSLAIDVQGEISNPGPVNLRRLPRHSLITRETRLGADGLQFIGSYRYDGYSLFDILKEKIVAKKNEAEFRSVIDLLVMVENRKGERVVFSWGEIYYPTALYRIIVADRVAPIVPSETQEQWPLPEKIKLVCGNDMVTERNIDEPMKITVFSAPRSLKTTKGLKPLYSPSFKLFSQGKEKEIIAVGAERRIYPSVFYGRGKGFHGIQRFNGFLFRDILNEALPAGAETIQHGYLTIVAADGYRVAVTWSELFNRNDQAEFLLLDRGQDENGGRFSLYPSCDFFSDRAVKAISTVFFDTI